MGCSVYEKVVLLIQSNIVATQVPLSLLSVYFWRKNKWAISETKLLIYFSYKRRHSKVKVSIKRRTNIFSCSFQEQFWVTTSNFKINFVMKIKHELDVILTKTSFWEVRMFLCNFDNINGSSVLLSPTMISRL